jgi:poly(3-hydroxybutyrate) depolymerase
MTPIRSRMGNALLVSIFLVPLAASALDAARQRRAQIGAEEKQLWLRIGGQERKYLLHVPESLPAGKKAPFVLVFHGGGSPAANTPNSPASMRWLIRRTSSLLIPTASTRIGMTRAVSRPLTMWDSFAA